MSERAIRLPRADSDDLPVPVVVLDRELQPTRRNEAWKKLEDDDVREEPVWLTICHPEDRAGVVEVLHGLTGDGGEATLQVRGRTLDQWIELRASAVDDIDGVVIVGLDITAQKQREALLTFDAVRDPLTGLYNRAALGQHLQTALDRLQRQPALLAVLFIDLDRFGEVNERYGHMAGDRALLIAAQQMRVAMRPADMLARVGGDEFVAVCESLRSAEEGVRIARRLGESMKEPIGLSPTADHELSATIGVAFAAAATDNVETLLSRADMAMYAGKRKGRGQIQVHAPEPTALGVEAKQPQLDDGTDALAERLAVVEADLAKRWADAVQRHDVPLAERWRSACHYAHQTLVALRHGEPPA